MGEQRTRTARVAAAVTASIGTALLLASCARLGLGPGSTTTAPPETVTTTSAEPSSSAPSSATPVSPTETTTPDAQTPTPIATAASQVSVLPFITSAAWDAKANAIDVSALVPKIVEKGGTCTATASRDGVDVHVAGAAVAASSYTGCPQLAITGSHLTAGTWEVRVSYRSDTSAGTSAVRRVTVG